MELMKCFCCGEEYDASNRVLSFTFEGEEIIRIQNGSPECVLKLCSRCLRAFYIGWAVARKERLPDGISIEYEVSGSEYEAQLQTKYSSMNEQCERCKIRKFCYEKEPLRDWTCKHYVDKSEFVSWIDG